MRLSGLLAGGAVVLLLVSLLAAVLNFGTGIDADAGTYVAVAAFFATVLGVLGWGHVRDDGLLLLLATAALLAYGQSMTLLLWDFTSFNLTFLRSPSPEEFSRAVWWAAGSTLLLAIGIVAGGSRRGQAAVAAVDDGQRPLLLRAFSFVVLAALAVMGLALALTVAYGVGAAGTETPRFAALANLFNRDMMLMLVLIATARHWSALTRVQRIGALAVFTMYLVVSVYQGSRGGLILILVMSLVTFASKLGDFRLSRKLLGYLLLAAVGTGAVVWPLATRIRSARIIDAELSTVQDVTAVSALQGGAVWNAIGFLHPILQRQGRIPQLIGVSNDWVPGAREQVQASGILLNTLAGLFPGPNPDPLAYPLIGRAYAIIFLGSPIDQIFAEEWSPAALVLFFAPPPVAIVLLVAWGFVLARSWRALDRRAGDLAHVVAVLFLYNLGFMMLASAVPDILLPQFIRWVVLCGALLAVYVVLERISVASIPPSALRPADGGRAA